VFDAMLVNNSTIAANKSGISGAGIYFVGVANALTLQSSIVANNTVAGTNADIATMATITIGGSNNLVTAAAAAANVTLPGDTLQSDPRLWPLADYGGVTHTMALQVGSPAADAGINPLSLASDQRGAGFARVLGTAADIGAFEGTLAPAPVLPVPLLPGWLAAWLAVLVGAGGWRALHMRRPSAIFVR
jgi:hypothetical protein